jgi:hypothetical protein
MLPRADAPARRLPYTTADMAERLAKKKAEQEAAAQAKANQALRFGVTNPPVKEDKGGGTGLWPSWKELGNAAKIGGKGVIGMVNTLGATPIDIADEAVQGLERLVGVTPTDKFDPASVGSFNLLGETYRAIDNAANYTAGNIAAIPGFGKPSSSPFMDTVRSRGWAEAFAEPVVHAVNVGSVAYPVSKMAVGAKLPGTIADAYRQRLLERDIAAQNNLFPAVQRPANVIDVDALQGSRLPARVVDSPATPATRLADAQTQRALPPAVQRALPPAEIAPAIAETPASRLTPPAFRERPVPASSRLTVEFAGGKNPDGTLNLTAGQDIIIRSYNQKTGEYTGAITIYYDPFTKKATVNGLGATNPMVTPQLIAAAASEIRKLVGDVKYPLTPDTSLSSTSRPFVERLQQAGLIDPAYKLPPIDNINAITELSGPRSFAPKKAGKGATVIDPLSYQPGYNEVLKALVESKRQAKLAGEYGRLTTPSSNLTPKQVVLLTERELAENATAHLATFTTPIDTITSTEFPLLDGFEANYRSPSTWGTPRSDTEVKQTLSFPVYEIGGEKIAFGNPGLGRFNPEFNAQDVQIIPVDPYRISGLHKTSAGGQHYAKLMFDAHQGLVFEQGGAENIGKVSALTYAASRGDNVAFNELERLAAIGKKSLMDKRLEATQKILSQNPNWENPNFWNGKEGVRVKTGRKDASGASIYRPMGIDDMFLVHQTNYAPTFDANGNIILKPFGDYPNTDKATGQQMMDEVTGKPSANIDRDSLHFTINHLVGGNYARPAPTSNSNVIIIPLRDVLDANSGSLDNLYAIDTFFTPPPGEGLVIPMQNGKVLYQGQFEADEFNDAVKAAINEIGRRHNRSPEYEAALIEGGGHYANTPNVDKRISQVGIQDIAAQYPEYRGGVIGTIHASHPIKTFEEFDNFDVNSARSALTDSDYWRLSRNARLRIYDSNTSKYTTGEINNIYPEFWGL